MILINSIKKKYPIKLGNVGKYCFFLGVFFLPTALPIAGIFLIIALVYSFINNKSIFSKDKVNLFIVVAIGLMIFSTIYNFLLQIPKEIEDSSNTFLWLNIFNWIPALLCFIGFQNYLTTKKDRLNFAKFFISGTVPFIASCFFQLFFDISGPFEILNGLIVWFQKPLEARAGISGLFSNRNYAGFWLAVSLPFSLYLSKKNLNSRINSISPFLISCSIIYLIILTNSRNAFIGLATTLIMFFGIKSILLFFFLIILFILIQNFFQIINLEITNLFPSSLQRFRDVFFIDAPRIVIFRSVLSFILERPLFGWGAGTFFLIYTNKLNMWRPPSTYFEPYHTHNLFLEMTFNFGIPAAILITSISIFIFIKATSISFSPKYKNDFFNLDKAWVTGTLVIFIMFSNDVTFYDGKISLLTSMLFSGLRCIRHSQENIKNIHDLA